MALKGLVISALGLLFPPFLLIGLFPLFYGARKLAYASMGLGLVDDAERPGAPHQLVRRHRPLPRAGLGVATRVHEGQQKARG